MNDYYVAGEGANEGKFILSVESVGGFGREDVGGLKKTMLGALNVGGIFNKTLERDKFVEQQRALGSTASTKELKKDYEGAAKASKATKKTEAAIAKHKATAGVDDEEHLKRVSLSRMPDFLLNEEGLTSRADRKYDR